ncbi:hypothetical protein Sjap_013281 [Stephania japonica]|uniref:Uncharacterized protein n=1 Tax=Stephania japonica TaxID=461633 RepID=A0AAP0IXL5_9MAGN
MVKALEISTTLHPTPYKISWIRKWAETKISDQCRVPFSLGQRYQDIVLCDVVEMDACHLLLGRPWQFDVRAIHRGHENTYVFDWYAKRVLLLPLPPTVLTTPPSTTPQLIALLGLAFTNLIEHNHHLFILHCKEAPLPLQSLPHLFTQS